MKRLNEEIKDHNEEKKRCIALENEVKFLKEELNKLRNIHDKRTVKPNQYYPPLRPTTSEVHSN